MRFMLRWNVNSHTHFVCENVLLLFRLKYLIVTQVPTHTPDHLSARPLKHLKHKSKHCRMWQQNTDDVKIIWKKLITSQILVLILWFTPCCYNKKIKNTNLKTKCFFLKHGLSEIKSRAGIHRYYVGFVLLCIIVHIFSFLVDYCGLFTHIF